MGYRLLADAVVVIHLAFVAFLAVGGLLAWRWPRLVWIHIPIAAWGAAIVAVGFTCPLTPLEKTLRRRAAAGTDDGGFIDHYVEGVVYPDGYVTHARVLVAGLIVTGYAGLLVRAVRPVRPKLARAESGTVQP